MIQRLPQDIKAEELLDFFSEKGCHVSVRGLHKRNACHDLVKMEEGTDGKVRLFLARKSLYNVLPEYFFHPYDRFTGLRKDEFSEEYERQQEEIDNALAFFEPVDLALLSLRLYVHRKSAAFVSTNSVLISLLSDSLTEEQKANRFVRKAVPFLVHGKYYRGNRMALTLMLRKIFEDESLALRPLKGPKLYMDDKPRYPCEVGDELGDAFAGNAFQEDTVVFEVAYWPEECKADFLDLVAEIRVFESFIRDYFLSAEESLSFLLVKDDGPIRLSDTKVFNYLSYNTNL